MGVLLIGRTHSFDKANRLLWASTNGQYESFRYDGDGRRTAITRTGGTTSQVYGRDGKFLYERSPSGATTRHIYLGNRLLVSVTGTTPTYAHTDHLGSVVRKSNAAGVQVDSVVYAPYGSVQAGTLNQGPGFTGHVNDAASGLVYMQQRYHDPIAMRFIIVDPVRPSTTDGGNFNRYWYANNNPYKYVDPDGRDPLRAMRLGPSSLNSTMAKAQADARHSQVRAAVQEAMPHAEIDVGIEASIGVAAGTGVQFEAQLGTGGVSVGADSIIGYGASASLIVKADVTVSTPGSEASGFVLKSAEVTSGAGLGGSVGVEADPSGAVTLSAGYGLTVGSRASGVVEQPITIGIEQEIK